MVLDHRYQLMAIHGSQSSLSRVQLRLMLASNWTSRVRLRLHVAERPRVPSRSPEWEICDSYLGSVIVILWLSLLTTRSPQLTKQTSHSIASSIFVRTLILLATPWRSSATIITHLYVFKISVGDSLFTFSASYLSHCYSIAWDILWNYLRLCGCARSNGRSFY